MPVHSRRCWIILVCDRPLRHRRAYVVDSPKLTLYFDRVNQAEDFAENYLIINGDFKDADIKIEPRLVFDTRRVLMYRESD